MASRRFISWILLALILGAGNLMGASSAENRAFKAASDTFNDGFWRRAEVGFAQFVTNYPASERIAEAVLFQAEAQIKQGRFAEAVTLLAGRRKDAGTRADEYLFWIGEAHFQNTNYTAAAGSFGELARDYPNSGRRLAAVVSEATARAKLGEWPRVIELLEMPDGVFQQAAAQAANELVARGRLLLAEADLALKKNSAAEAALQPLDNQSLPPELGWRKNYLRIQAELAEGKPEAARNTSTNLVAAAQATGRHDLLAESVVLQADIFERLGQKNEAIAALKSNLDTNAPPEQQRQALLKITDLALAQNRPGEAGATLETFLGQFPAAPAADVALFTLGELHLKQHVAVGSTNAGGGALPTTNHWVVALGLFDRLVGTFSNSPYVGKAELDRGWCFWLSNQMPESVEAFRRAVARLPASEDLAIARFKLGDALYVQKDFTGARDSYRAALEAFAGWPRLKEALSAQALYQLLRAGIELGDRVSASEAMRQILALPAGQSLADRSVLLVGQSFADAGEPEKARGEYEKFLKLVPDSPLRPEIELAIARTHEQQGDWPGAMAEYEAWLERFPTNALLPQAEFQRAWVNFQAGNETNALTLFTNFAVRFTANTALASQAQWWVADFDYRQGKFAEAEKNYKILFQNWPGAELAYEARMMAGRAALGWSGYLNAIDHFTNLTSDLKCPPGLKARAMFAYGDALMAMPSSGTNKLANYTEAVRVFGKLQQEYATNEIAVLAWGELGKCFRQLANEGEDAQFYNSASNAYTQVIVSTASVTARSEAQVGWGELLEEMAHRRTGGDQRALLEQALDNYLPVLREENLQPGETPDAFWVKKAGLQAARVVETLGEWKQAENLYRRLQELLPPLRATLEAKIERARNLSREKN